MTGGQSGGVYTVTKQAASYLDTGTYLCTVDNGVSDRRGRVEQSAKTSVLVRGEVSLPVNQGLVAILVIIQHTDNIFVVPNH